MIETSALAQSAKIAELPKPTQAPPPALDPAATERELAEIREAYARLPLLPHSQRFWSWCGNQLAHVVVFLLMGIIALWGAIRQRGMLRPILIILGMLLVMLGAGQPVANETEY